MSVIGTLLSSMNWSDALYVVSLNVDDLVKSVATYWSKSKFAMLTARRIKINALTCSKVRNRYDSVWKESNKAVQKGQRQ